jgi:membrane associated rhomboid family serine protease
MQSNSWSRAQYAWQQSGSPLTLAIIVINFITMVLVTFRVPIGEWLAFIVPGSLARPWTVLTYPLLSASILQMLFYGLFLYWIGSSLERSWGTRFYAIYFGAMSVISALGIALGYYVLQVQFDWAENWLPVAALTLTFCLLNPGEQISIWGVLPITAKWLAVAEVVIVFFLYAQNHAHPLMGFFALAGCGAAYLWVRTRAWRDIATFSRQRPTSSFRPTKEQLYSSGPLPRRRTKAQRPPKDDETLHLNPLDRLARWRRRRQFERLFEDDKK